jgi:hypothetical protein
MRIFLSKSHHSQEFVVGFVTKTCNRGGEIQKEDSSLRAAIINTDTEIVSIAGKTQIHYPKIEKNYNKDKTFFEKLKFFFWGSKRSSEVL